MAMQVCDMFLHDENGQNTGAKRFFILKNDDADV
jgi:hypothetical protein